MKKPFDPWTATPEERRNIALSSCKELEEKGRLAADSPFAKLCLWLKLKEAELEYNEDGIIDGGSLLWLIDRCLTAEIAIPKWLKTDYSKRVAKLFSVSSRTWEDIFGKFQKQNGQSVDRNTRGHAIQKEIDQRIAEGKSCPKDRGNLGTIAEELKLKCSDSEAEKSLQQWQRLEKKLPKFWERFERFNN